MNEQSSFSTAKKPQIVETVLQMFHEAGIKDHEPQLVVQLSDFAYALTKEILMDAKTLSDFSNRKQISKEDVEFTINAFQRKYKPMRPSKQTLTELAYKKNTQALPPLKQNFGLRLPSDRFCQVQPNYEYIGTNGAAATNGGSDDSAALPPAKRRPPVDTAPRQFDAESVLQMLDSQPPAGQPPSAYGSTMMEEDFD